MPRRLAVRPPLGRPLADFSQCTLRELSTAAVGVRQCAMRGKVYSVRCMARMGRYDVHKVSTDTRGRLVIVSAGGGTLLRLDVDKWEIPGG